MAKGALLHISPEQVLRGLLTRDLQIVDLPEESRPKMLSRGGRVMNAGIRIVETLRQPPKEGDARSSDAHLYLANLCFPFMFINVPIFICIFLNDCVACLSLRSLLKLRTLLYRSTQFRLEQAQVLKNADSSLKYAFTQNSSLKSGYTYFGVSCKKTEKSTQSSLGWESLLSANIAPSNISDVPIVSLVPEEKVRKGVFLKFQHSI